MERHSACPISIAGRDVRVQADDSSRGLVCTGWLVRCRSHRTHSDHGLLSARVRRLPASEHHPMLTVPPLSTQFSSPYGRAMTDTDQTTFDATMPQYCVDARQGFFNALKTWPTASINEINHFNSLIQSLGSAQPTYWCVAEAIHLVFSHVRSGRCSSDLIIALLLLDP